MKKVLLLLSLLSMSLSHLTVSAAEQEVLMFATNGLLDALKALVEKNHELINARDSQGNNPLFLASENGNLATVQFLLNAKSDPNTQNKLGQTPLMVTTMPAIAQALLNAGASLEKVDATGNSALSHAVSEWETPMVELLVARGANVNMTDPTGNSILLNAVMDNKPEIVQALLKSPNANINATDGILKLPMLFWAISQASHLMVRVLVAQGANVQFVDAAGQTVLMYAACMGQPYIVYYLLTAGADKNAKDKDGKTAYDYAVAAGFAVTAELLGDGKMKIIAAEKVEKAERAEKAAAVPSEKAEKEKEKTEKPVKILEKEASGRTVR